MTPLKCIKTEVRVESTDIRVKMKGVINPDPCNKRERLLHKFSSCLQENAQSICTHSINCGTHTPTWRCGQGLRRRGLIVAGLYLWTDDNHNLCTPGCHYMFRWMVSARQEQASSGCETLTHITHAVGRLIQLCSCQRYDKFILIF